MTPATTHPVNREPEMPRHLESMARLWVSTRQSLAITRHSTLGDDGVSSSDHATQMNGGECENRSELSEQEMEDICLTTLQHISLGPDEPESRHEEILAENYPKQDMALHERDQDALRAAFANRHNLVLDSTVSHVAPHIVVTPPEQNIRDFYTPWLNAPGPQWTSHLMVTMPPNAMDHTLTPLPLSHQERETGPSFVQTARAVFCLSKFKTFITTLMRERVVMNNIVNVLQKHCRKAVALAASASAQRFWTCEPYICLSEKPFHWTDPAEPFLQRRNQFRGTIVIESSSPFSVPHIIINEPPPQDPWIAWYNATTSPQDGYYLTVPHRPVWYINMPDGVDDCWGSPFPSPLSRAEEQLDVEDADISISGSPSSSETEPGTPGLDSSIDDFLLDEDDHGFLDSDIQDGINFFDSCDDSPWSGIINRYFHKVAAPMPDQVVDSEIESSNLICDDDENDLPPFDNWYQSVASRSMMTTATI